MDRFLRTLPCKTSFLILLLLLMTSSSDAQLTGSFTIPGGSYPSIKYAIAELNNAGVGTGGVTFNITAGYTETFISTTDGLITATGTQSNPIVFQRSGQGANPVITAGTGTGKLDGIIILAGTDYITFDGIDVKENNSNTTSIPQMEWGYALLKKSSTIPYNGCQYVNLKNCTVALNKSNTATEGIHIHHL